MNKPILTMDLLGRTMVSYDDYLDNETYYLEKMVEDKSKYLELLISHSMLNAFKSEIIELLYEHESNYRIIADDVIKKIRVLLKELETNKC